MNDPDDIQHIRRVSLPSGKVIEVITFGGVEARREQATAALPAEAAAPGADRAPAAPTRGDTAPLHVCRHCRGELVYPLDWSEAGPRDWEVTLRCPECEWRHTGVFPQAAVDRFDVELDEGADILLRDLQALSHANMADDVACFCRALELDLIEPSDFSI